MAEEKIGIEISIEAAESAKTIGDLKKSIKELQDAAVAAGSAGDDALASKFTKAAAAARDRMSDLNEEINTMKGAPEKFGAIANAAQGIAGGFAAAQGAAALFGASQEDVQKQLLKVQAATAMLQGIQQASDISRQLYLVKNIALQEISTAQTKLQTIAETGGVVARNAAAAAQWALNAATNAFPALIIIGAITALVAALKNLGDSAEEASLKQAEANKKAMESWNERRDHDLEVLKSMGKDTAEIEAQQVKERIARIQAERQRIQSDENLDAEEKRKRTDELYNQESQALDRLEILRAEAYKKQRDEEAKSAEDTKTAHEKELEENAAFLKAKEDAQRKHYQELARIKEEEDKKADELRKIRIADEKAMLDEEHAMAAEADANEITRKADVDAFVEGLNRDRANRNKILFQGQLLTQAEYAKKYRELKMAENKADADLFMARATMANDTLNNIKELGNNLIKDQKKLENFNKKAALIQLGIDSGKAIASAISVASAASVTPVDLALKIAAATATVAVNIAKARNMIKNAGSSGSESFSGGGLKTAGTGIGGGSDVDVTLKTPSSGVGGGGRGALDRLTNTGAPRVPTKEECNCPQIGTGSTMLDSNGNPIAPIIKAIVVESDITQSQQTIKGIRDRNTFG